MSKTYMPTMHGTEVILREVCKSDIDDRLSLGPNPEYHKYFGDDVTVMRDRSELEKMWFDDIEVHNESLIMQATHQVTQIEVDGKWIGSASLANIDFRHRRADLVVGIYDQNYWDRGYGLEVVRLILDYAFERLNLHRISGNIISNNERSLAMVKKIGFRVEGTMKDYFWIDDSWKDSIRVFILDSDFRNSQAKTPKYNK